MSNRTPLHQQHGTRQFVKFCIVGVSSTIINFGFFNLLYHKTAVGLVPSLTIAFFLSMLNGFFWNRRWTFRESRVNSAATQSLRFFAVNVVGWILNTSIVVLIVAHYQSGGNDRFFDILAAVVAGQGRQHFGALLLNAALGVATCVVVFWNFFANRFWTFKHHKPA
jgi:putative flippase GtrA